jgi:glycosyltransferase involved in cell wall biosynthesis
MGVDVDMYNVKDRNTNPNPNSILFLGRITPKKKIDVMLVALTNLTRKQIRFTFDIYGAPGEGDEPYLKDLHSKFEELECRGSISFRGAVPHDKTPVVYAAHEIVVHPGSLRGFNKKLFEALASGCIVVTSDPSMRGVVDDRLFVSGSDEKEFASALESALALTSEEKNRERAKLQAYVRREHALSSVVPAMLEMLRRKGGEAGE